MVDTLVIPLLKIVILLNAILIAVTYMVLLERKVMHELTEEQGAVLARVGQGR